MNTLEKIVQILIAFNISGLLFLSIAAVYYLYWKKK